MHTQQKLGSKSSAERVHIHKRGERARKAVVSHLFWLYFVIGTLFADCDTKHEHALCTATLQISQLSLFWAAMDAAFDTMMAIVWMINTLVFVYLAQRPGETIKFAYRRNVGRFVTSVFTHCDAAHYLSNIYFLLHVVPAVHYFLAQPPIVAHMALFALFHFVGATASFLIDSPSHTILCEQARVQLVAVIGKKHNVLVVPALATERVSRLPREPSSESGHASENMAPGVSDLRVVSSAESARHSRRCTYPAQQRCVLAQDRQIQLGHYSSAITRIMILFQFTDSLNFPPYSTSPEKWRPGSV